MKNAFLLSILFVICLRAEAQTSIKFILTSNLKIDDVSIMDISQQENYQMPYQDTLTFNFKKNDLDCYNLRYSVGGKVYWKQVWLNAGNTIIKAHLSDTAHIVVDTVANSPIYYSVTEYQRMVKVLRSDTSARNQYMLEEIQRYIETPRALAIASDYVNFNQNSRINLLNLKAVLASQKKDLSWSIYYDIGISRLNKLLDIRKLNLSAFWFKNKAAQHTQIQLKESYRYLVDFWFVGCVPCMQDHKELKTKLETLTKHKVQIISISIDKDPGPWKQYLEKNNYHWDNYLQTDTNRLSDYFGIRAFPAYYILDSQGEILNSFSSLQNALESLNLK